MKRRDSTRVVHDILLIAGHGAVKTQIVQGANLNSRLTKSYLDFLTRKSYLARHHSDDGISTVYRLTEEGRILLETLRRVESQLQGLFPNRGTNDARRRP